MAEQRSSERGERSNGFSYFMIRIQPAGPAGGASISGTVERLGTGEKRSFADGAQLLELLGAWPGAPKMQAAVGTGNGEHERSP